jgi:hypothetical protein
LGEAREHRTSKNSEWEAGAKTTAVLPSPGSTLSSRGVYFIFDQVAKQGYVGSAYGDENIYGRWANYATSGDGGNKRLCEPAPDGFLFSILEVVSPAMEPTEVIKLEGNWKDRLHTRGAFGLNLN